MTQQIFKDLPVKGSLHKALLAHLQKERIFLVVADTYQYLGQFRNTVFIHIFKAALFDLLISIFVKRPFDHDIDQLAASLRCKIKFKESDQFIINFLLFCIP